MTSLAFPKVGAPEVSVLMVTYGGWSFVRDSLRALLEGTDPIYELIVVDNASPDGTAERLRDEVEGARLFFNAENLGFGRAANQAAALARAPALVFLNSDASVHPGWLAPMVESLRVRPRVGAVAPCVLNPGGSLQEAGGLVFRDGSTTLYGNAEDPRLPQFRFPRSVDYASAVCLMVRRRAFEEEGGFDPLFAPAYYEDADLCFRLRRRGLRTLYEPRAAVTHLMGGSSRHETAVTLTARNRTRFETRWRDELASRPERGGETPDPVALIRARDALASPRFLLLSPDSGVARQLAARYPEARVSVLMTHIDTPQLYSLLAAGIEVVSTEDESRWLESRPFHYDVVSGETIEALKVILRHSQPQAQCLHSLSHLGIGPRT